MKHFILYLIIMFNFLLTPIKVKITIPIPTYQIIPITDTELSIRTSLVSNIAKEYIGIPYNYGSANKHATDCSGLVQQMYIQIDNIKLPRTSTQMSRLGVKVCLDSLEVGDLLCFSGHVAMYINNDSIVHATSQGVVYNIIGDNVWNSYWIKRYKFSKRIL